MSYQSIPLLAGVPHRLDIAGRVILIDSVSASDGVSIEILLAGSSKTNTVPRRKAGFRLVQAYDGVILTSAVDAIVGIFLSNDDVQLGVADGAAVSMPGGVIIANPDPIPVLFGGLVAPVLGNVKVTNTDADAIPMVQKMGTVFTVEQATEVDTRPYMAAAVADLAAVAVTDVRAVMVAASAARRGLRIKNAGISAVAIGGVSVAFATAAVQILPGETWMENEAAPAAWYCVCAVGTSSGLNIQTVT